MRFESGLLRRRGVALLLTLAVEALLLLLLLFLVPPVPGGKKANGTATFSLDASEDSAETSDTSKTRAKPHPTKATPRPPMPQPPVIPPPPVPVPETPRGPLPFIVMTRDEYRASRVENMVTRPSEPGSPSAAAAGSGRPDTPLAPGRGPGGEPLYAAEWYTRPTNAQLNGYISSRARTSGWGLIACRTIANYRVEDCQELGESPRGSGLAGSVRQAAWQFRVRPPRVGGKELVGEWVAIRVDYTFSTR